MKLLATPLQVASVRACVSRPAIQPESEDSAGACAYWYACKHQVQVRVHGVSLPVALSVHMTERRKDSDSTQHWPSDFQMSRARPSTSCNQGTGRCSLVASLLGGINLRANGVWVRSVQWPMYSDQCTVASICYSVGHAQYRTKLLTTIVRAPSWKYLIIIEVDLGVHQTSHGTDACSRGTSVQLFVYPGVNTRARKLPSRAAMQRLHDAGAEGAPLQTDSCRGWITSIKQTKIVGREQCYHTRSLPDRYLY
eukprot:6173647-Pleurochrysis_carterae.AAC.1